MFRETHVNMDLLHEYLLYYRYLLFKNTCDEMTIQLVMATLYKFLLSIHLNNNHNRVWRVTHFENILRHRFVGTHHVQNLTPQSKQRKQGPASHHAGSF